jgi:hypothetical protein
MQKESKRIHPLTVLAGALGLGMTSLFAQTPDNKPAAKPGETVTSPPLSDFLYDDPGNVLLQDAIFGVDLGESDVGEVSCRHLAFVEQAIDWQIWIEQGKQRVPRKLVITYKMRPGAPEYIALFSDWDFTTPIAGSLFSAEIPDGAEATSFIKVKPAEVPEKAQPAEPAKNE